MKTLSTMLTPRVGFWITSLSAAIWIVNISILGVSWQAVAIAVAMLVQAFVYALWDQAGSE